MALGSSSSSSKKHRKSRREDGSKPIPGAIEGSPRPIKSLMQAFWRRHSSTHQQEKSDKNSTTTSSNGSSSIEKSSSRNRTQSPVSGSKANSPAVSSLEQALRIARGQVEDPDRRNSVSDEDSVYDETNDNVAYHPAVSQNNSNNNNTGNGGYLPRIPEHLETDYSESSAAQMERLKASVVRRTNSRSDRNEFNSAPPGIYWPDGETSIQTPQSNPQMPMQHQKSVVHQSTQQNTPIIDRLPRIPPLSRPTSTVFFPGTRSPPVTSFCASPARTVSPTPFLHRPLPPPPQGQGQPVQQLQPTPFIDRRGDKMSKSFNYGGSRSGPMWQAILPPRSPTGELLEVVDTTVYSNVKIPLLR